MGDLLVSFGRMLGYFFINPLLYISGLVLFFVSWRRLKEERDSFHTRVYARISDWMIPFIPSLIAGGILSVITGAVGIVWSKAFFVLLVSLFVITVLTSQLRFMTPAYVFGIVLLLYGIVPYVDSVPIIQTAYAGIGAPIAIVCLLALFLFTEGVLIQKSGINYTSPTITTSKRGQWIGSHIARRLWVVPVLLFIPEGVIPLGGYWPVFSLGETAFQPILFPFLIGFRHEVRSALPKVAIRLLGKQVMFFSFIIGLLALIAFFFSYGWVYSLIGAIALIGRTWISRRAKKKEYEAIPFFTKRSKGCVVLGVLPNSPADKMGIHVGETIARVNGEDVYNEESFYQALQLNAAFCKLHVLNDEGEVRFAQGAIYTGEHHQLGVLLVREDVELQDSII